MGIIMNDYNMSEYFESTPTFETVGAPEGYRHYKINTDNIRCMRWDPIGRWEKQKNGILKLGKDPCELKVMYMDGWAQTFSFAENDFRVMVGKWIVIFCKDLAICKPFSPKDDPS
jgi:hypothetical protein